MAYIMFSSDATLFYKTNVPPVPLSTKLAALIMASISIHTVWTLLVGIFVYMWAMFVIPKIRPTVQGIHHMFRRYKGSWFTGLSIGSIVQPMDEPSIFRNSLSWCDVWLSYLNLDESLPSWDSVQVNHYTKCECFVCACGSILFSGTNVGRAIDKM